MEKCRELGSSYGMMEKFIKANLIKDNCMAMELFTILMDKWLEEFGIGEKTYIWIMLVLEKAR